MTRVLICEQLECVSSPWSVSFKASLTQSFLSWANEPWICRWDAAQHGLLCHLTATRSRAEISLDAEYSPHLRWAPSSSPDSCAIKERSNWVETLTYSLPRGSHGWKRSWNGKDGAGNELCLFQECSATATSAALAPLIPFSWAANGSSTPWPMQETLLGTSKSPNCCILQAPSAGGQAAQGPASLCPLLFILPTLVFPALPVHPEKFAGGMSRMGSFFTQKNLKKKQLEDASFAHAPPWHPWSYL